MPQETKKIKRQLQKQTNKQKKKERKKRKAAGEARETLYLRILSI